MEMQVVQAEAIKILIERVEDLKNAGINLENRFEALQKACGDDNIRIQKLENQLLLHYRIKKLERESNG